MWVKGANLESEQLAGIKPANLASVSSRRQFRHSSLGSWARLDQLKSRIEMRGILEILDCHIIRTITRSFHLELHYQKIK